MTPEEKKQVRILIVDDEAVIRKLLRLVMEKHGYTEVDDAESGEEAVAALRKNDYHVVFLDKNMPGMDGISVLRIGRSIRPACQFIIITAFGSEESVIEAIDLGAHSYLTKPLVDLGSVAARTEHAIKQANIIKARVKFGQPAAPMDNQPSVKSFDIDSVKADISTSSNRLQALADRLKEMKRKKD
jgi:DNA-binding response OmpR family regulator